MKIETLELMLGWYGWRLDRIAKSNHRIYREEATGRVMTVSVDHGGKRVSPDRVGNVRQHLRRLAKLEQQTKRAA